MLMSIENFATVPGGYVCEITNCYKSTDAFTAAKLAAKLMLANVGLFGYTADRDDSKGFLAYKTRCPKVDLAVIIMNKVRRAIVLWMKKKSQTPICR